MSNDYLIQQVQTLKDDLRKTRKAVTVLQRTVKGLVQTMSDFNTAEQDLETSEGALETRVAAHEANLKQISTDLQTQIDALKAANADPAAVAKLVALKAKMDAFDPDAAPAPTPTPAPVPTPAPSGDVPATPAPAPAPSDGTAPSTTGDSGQPA